VEATEAPKVYVAGPLGFTESGRQYHTTVVLPTLRSAGFEPLDPWDLDDELQAVLDLPKKNPDRDAQLPTVNRAIGRRNAELIQNAAVVLAFLDGPDVDSGTAAEIGYAAALHRPVVGIRTDTRVSGDNEATVVNLQVEWFVLESGGAFACDLDDAVAAIRHRVDGTTG